MPIDPVCVCFVITDPDGAVLENGEGTIGEVDTIRDTLTHVFPQCTLHVTYLPRIAQPPQLTCEDCERSAHCKDFKDHRCACPECIEGRLEFLWEREHGI